MNINDDNNINHTENKKDNDHWMNKPIIKEDNVAFKIIYNILPFIVVYLWTKVRYEEVVLSRYFFMVVILYLINFSINLIKRNIKKKKEDDNNVKR